MQTAERRRGARRMGTFSALIEGLDWTRVHGQRVQAPRETQ
jgi:hypothetical protein